MYTSFAEHCYVQDPRDPFRFGFATCEDAETRRRPADSIPGIPRVYTIIYYNMIYYITIYDIIYTIYYVLCTICYILYHIYYYILLYTTYDILYTTLYDM